MTAADRFEDAGRLAEADTVRDAALDAHLHDGWPTGHAFKRSGDATWTHILGGRTQVELHADDHRYLPEQFGHTHDPGADR